MVQLYTHKKDCSGCTACFSICPQSAISMISDDEGFAYPSIDNEKCISCGICKKVCPFHPAYKKNDNFETPLVFAAKHKDSLVRMNSSSGGMFTALSDIVLRRKGVVYGAVFDATMNVVHARAETASERDVMRGSKYIQSGLQQTFFSVKNDLLNNRMVLFSGTPCQVAGLGSFLCSIDRTNLLLCDLVCHGVASPSVWHLFLEFLKKKYKAEVVQFHFRFKSGMKTTTILRAILSDGKEVSSSDLEIFNRIYFGMWASRPACHHCMFSKLQRLSDVTIADFWGIEKYKSGFSDGKSVSLVLVNSEKGRILFNEASENIELAECSIEQCLQPNLKAPSAPSPQRTLFMEDIITMPFKKALRKHGIYDTPVIKLKKGVKRALRTIVTINGK